MQHLRSISRHRPATAQSDSVVLDKIGEIVAVIGMLASVVDLFNIFQCGVVGKESSDCPDPTDTDLA